MDRRRSASRSELWEHPDQVAVRAAAGPDARVRTSAPIVATEGELAIRLLRNDPADIALLTSWRAQPYVHAWWHPDRPAPSFDEVSATYGPQTHPSSPTTPCLIELEGRPIGYIQFYRWAAFAEEADAMHIEYDEDTFGLDVMIGVAELTDRGIGSRAVDLLCRHLEQERNASRFALTTDIENFRAQRAYEKAGFEKVRAVLDLDQRGGERARSWLMVRVRK